MSGMTRGVVRRIALGITLAVAFAVVPARPAAAAPAEPSIRAADFWEAAIEWLASLVGSDPAAGGGGTSGAAACRGDQGACVDPNG